MLKVKQKTDDDCLRCVIATLLNKDYSHVPNFYKYGPEWWKILWKYLNNNGYECSYERKPMKDRYCIGFIRYGLDPWHSHVRIYLNQEMVFEPHERFVSSPWPPTGYLCIRAINE